MKLVEIPDNKYYDYKLNAMFDCYKWDPEFEDNNTVAKHVLVISKEEHEMLKKYTEDLDKEIIAAENYLKDNLNLIKPLSVNRKIKGELHRMKNYDPEKHIRLMRYDFHPVVGGGFAVSEVNSDVPGGFAEATLLPELAKKTLAEDKKDDNYWFIKFGNILADAISKKVKANGTIMMVHCTCYSDDRQVMQYLGDKLSSMGYKILYGAADHLNFKDGKAYSVLNGNKVDVDGIFRFTPLEWLYDIKPKRWEGYFDTITPSCNHPVAIFFQTKKFPLIFEALEKRGFRFDTWKKLLPETMEVRKARGKEGFIFKPAYGRVGERISIKEACNPEEYKKIMLDVKLHPSRYIAQKKFISREIESTNGEKFHVCLGSYSVEGKHAGYYARISKTPRIDSNAADIPVLIEEE